LASKPAPASLVVLGDTMLNDGTAFTNLREALGVPGLAFICHERSEAPPQLQRQDDGIVISNRWDTLGDFAAECRRAGFAIDERTALVVDLDKTALGARGRNDRMIDEARLEGVRDTADELLGDAYDEDLFLAAYHTLNRSQYHHFTADNQDYLVMVSMMVGARMWHLPDLLAAVESGALQGFGQFMDGIEARRQELEPLSLRTVYDTVYSRFLAGDPTPFKEFRYHEYRATIARMGALSGLLTATEALQGEIVITREVTDAISSWAQAGATPFGLSDKPDEAALPTPDLAAQGLPPLHEALTHRVGAAITC
jgi:hypothetical protein